MKDKYYMDEFSIKPTDVIVITFDAEQVGSYELKCYYENIMKELPKHTIVALPKAASFNVFNKEDLIMFLESILKNLNGGV